MIACIRPGAFCPVALRRAAQHCPRQDRKSHCGCLWLDAETLPVFLPPQNGQTAESVASGSSHQDIVDLLKAHAQSHAPGASTADLLWARPDPFTEPAPSGRQTKRSKVTWEAPSKTERVQREKPTFLVYCGSTFQLGEAGATYGRHYPPHLCQHALRGFLDMLHQPLSGQKTKSPVGVEDETPPPCSWQGEHMRSGEGGMGQHTSEGDKPAASPPSLALQH